MLGLNRRGDLPLMRRLIAFRPSRDTLLPNRGLLPQISQTADTETPIPYVIASGSRATKRSVVARAKVMLGAKPPTMQARRDRPNPEKSAVRRSERMQDTSARGPMLLLISRTSATRVLALIGPIKSGSQVRDRSRPGPRCRHLRVEQQGSTWRPIVRVEDGRRATPVPLREASAGASHAAPGKGRLAWLTVHVNVRLAQERNPPTPTSPLPGCG
jgi:hypothetical protein